MLDQLVKKCETKHFGDKSLAICQHLTALTGKCVLHGPDTSTPVSAERPASQVARCICSLWLYLDSVSMCVAPGGQKTLLLIPLQTSALPPIGPLPRKSPSENGDTKKRGMHPCAAKVQMASLCHIVLLLIFFLEWLQMLENRKMLSLGSCLQMSHKVTSGKRSGRQDDVQSTLDTSPRCM